MKYLNPRTLVRSLFLAVLTCTGIRFYLFVESLEKGVLPAFLRPPGVEAFLPVSALVSLKHLVLTGTVNRIHPAGLVLFLLICATALFARRGFCAWVCPVGLMSGLLSKLGHQVFKRRMRIPARLDLLLQSIK